MDPVDRSADQWFWDHYEWAADRGAGVPRARTVSTLADREVADVGCGDGIIDLGLVHHGQPRRLVGFDVNPVREDLLARARGRGAGGRRAADRARVRGQRHHEAAGARRQLRRRRHAGRRSSTSTILRPCSREIRRVLRPDGALFLQLWPFYHSQHGAHLDEWYPEGFVQFQTRRRRRSKPTSSQRADDEGWARYKLGEYRTLNELTVDDLGHAVEAAGFRITKLQLISERVPLPPEVGGMDLSRLGISGIMLLAR